MEREPNIDDIWYEWFGHGYNHCVQLSKLPGELGELHKHHIDYVRKLVTTTIKSNYDEGVASLGENNVGKRDSGQSKKLEESE